MQFPNHKSGLYLSHNEHKDYYQTAKYFIEEEESNKKDVLQWATGTSRERCIETDEIWRLQWYPNTPIGFYVIYGATLEEVLEKANS